MKPVERLLEAYADNVRALFALAVSIVKDPAEAEEVLQDVIVKLLSEPESISEVSRPLAFLRSCVRNEAIDHVRALGMAAPTPDEALASVRDFSSEDEFETAESMMWLQGYLKDQPEEMRRAFTAYVIDGYTITQIARSMGLKPDALRKRFNVIKDKIRRTEKKKGFRF